MGALLASFRSVANEDRADVETSFARSASLRDWDPHQVRVYIVSNCKHHAQAPLIVTAAHM